MRCWLATLVALVAVQFTSVAHAQPSADDTQVVPSLGVPVQPSRGLFAELQVGTFFAIGGHNGVSDAAPFLGLLIGYDLSDSLAVGMGLSFGASTNTCFAGADDRGSLCEKDQGFTEGSISGAESFSIVLADGFLTYLVGITGQWYVGGRLVGGLAILSPRPVVQAGVSPLGADFGFNVGGIATTEFHTYLNHLVVGLDLGVHFISGGGASFVGVAVYPRLKYVF